MLNRDAGLLDQTFERAGFDRFVHRNDYGATFFPENHVGSGLSALFEPETTQSFDRVRAMDVARQPHATAKTGSCTK